MTNLASVERLAKEIMSRQESITQSFGASEISTAFSDFRARFTDENHRIWNRRRRDSFNDQWPEWESPPPECIRKYNVMMSHYVDIAASVLVRYLKGERLEDLQCAADHARAADNLFWSLNRKPASGLDKTLERLDKQIIRAIQPLIAGNSNFSVSHILAILPDGLGPLEHFLSKTYLACNGQDLPSSEEGRSLLWAIGFDYGKLADVPPALPCEPAHAARAEAASLILGTSISDLGDLLDQHDALAYLSSFVEPLWGFKGWPGLVLSAVRRASGEE
jgi:hypothetical protein